MMYCNLILCNAVKLVITQYILSFHSIYYCDYPTSFDMFSTDLARRLQVIQSLKDDIQTFLRAPQKGRPFVKVWPSKHVMLLAEMMTDALYMGHGTYNRIYALEGNFKGVVVRLSQYMPSVTQAVGEKIIDKKQNSGVVYETLSRAKLTNEKYLQQAMYWISFDPVCIKNNFSRLTNTLITNNVCPHYVYMFGEMDIKDFENTVIELAPPRTDVLNRYNNVSFHERMNDNLDTLIRKRVISNRQLKSCLFQVIYALCVLQHYIPEFRHNDLWLSNIFVNIKNHREQKQTHVYTIFGKTYHLIDTDCLAFIADFDLASAPILIQYADKDKTELLDPPMAPAYPNLQRPINFNNDTVLGERFLPGSEAKGSINSTHNPMFDTYMLLINLYNTIQSSRDLYEMYLDTISFISRVIPAIETARESPYYNQRIAALDQQVKFQIHPFHLINDSYFAEVLATKESGKSSTEIQKALKFTVKELPIEVKYFRPGFDEQASREPKVYYLPPDQAVMNLQAVGPGNVVRFFDKY